jgi:type I restriction enzyme S subunit
MEHNGWQHGEFRELCSDSAFGPRFSGKLYERRGNVAVLRTTDISADGRINLRQMPRAQVDLNKLGKHLLKSGDLIITRSGRVGTAALFKDFDVPVLPGAFSIRFRLDPRRGEPLFYRYYFNSPAGQRALLSVATGSVQQNLTSPAILGLDVPIPTLHEQRSIAGVLGSLDDKIELNRRMNQSLEEICRTLFKFWFVDFGPARSKAEGRWKRGETLPGCPADMRGLWPSEFEESEIGEIPRGWKVEGLGEVSTCRREMVDPSELDPEERYVGLEHISPHSLSLWNWGRVGDTVSGKARFKRGDVLFGKLRPYFHKVCVPAFDGVASTDILSITPKSSHWFGFVLGHLDSSALVDYATAASNGTKMPRTNWADLANWQVAVPPPELAHGYSSLIAPMISKLGSAIDESGMLAAARDALLPKLLSGEIRVKGDT